MYLYLYYRVIISSSSSSSSIYIYIYEQLGSILTYRDGEDRQAAESMDFYGAQNKYLHK